MNNFLNSFEFAFNTAMEIFGTMLGFTTALTIILTSTAIIIATIWITIERITDEK